MLLFRKTMLVIASILIFWLIVAPGCLTFRTSDKKAKSEFAKRGLQLHTGYVKVNGRDIYYAEVGNDSLPTLFFVHGSPSTWSAFSDYMNDPDMLAHFRMVGIDRPGFGYSVEPGAVHLKEQSHILLGVVLELSNGKPAYLAGHSLGGPIVAQMAADYPDLFKGIALISGSVDPSLEPKENWRKAFNRAPLSYFLPGAFKPSNEELLYFKSDVFGLAAEFEKIKCPVVLIHGEKDKWVPVGNTDYALKKLVHAVKVEKVIIPEANHFIPWTKKSEVKAALIKMASGNEPAQVVKQ